MGSDQRYRERPPRPDVAAAVSCGWLLEVTADRIYEHRTVPNGSVEIICGLRTGELRVTGPQHGPILERLASGECLVGLRFRPGAAASVLGVPAADLVDLVVDLEDVWGRAAADLRERIRHVATPAGAPALLADAVARRLSGAPAVDPLIAGAVERLQPWRDGRVGEVSSELFVSPRQMGRRFHAALGYGPKTLQRVLRFQGFLALVDSLATSDIPLVRLASLAGYADQAHLTRECRRLTGLSPSAFLETLRESCAPTHDHAASYAAVRRSLLSERLS